MKLDRSRVLRWLAVVVVVGINLAGAGMATVAAQPQARLLIRVVKAARPPQRPEPPKGPAVLSSADKVRRLKDVLVSLRDEQQRSTNLHLEKVFPLNLTAKPALTLQPMPELLTSRHPYLGTSAYLNFAGPAYVSGWTPAAGFSPKQGSQDSNQLELYLDMVAGTTYLLDYSIGDYPGTVKVWFPYVESMGYAPQIDMPVLGGHLLVPYLAPTTGRNGIWVSGIDKFFTFYSLEISTVE